MEVIKESVAMLSNYEVYSLLSDIQAGRGQNKPNKQQQNLATITYETVKYLEGTACVMQTPELTQQFMKAVEPFNLSKAEKMQLLNQRPTSAVEIQLIVEESEERLTEDQIYELLDVVAKYILGGDEEEGEGEEEMEDQEDETDAVYGVENGEET